MAYHINKIKKGILGSSSKIQEELEELIDAEKQKCKIMILLELSDIYGAIKAYLSNNYPDIKMSDLAKMSEITESAFNDGTRE